MPHMYSLQNVSHHSNSLVLMDSLGSEAQNGLCHFSLPSVTVGWHARLGTETPATLVRVHVTAHLGGIVTWRYGVDADRDVGVSKLVGEHAREMRVGGLGCLNSC